MLKNKAMYSLSRTCQNQEFQQKEYDVEKIVDQRKRGNITFYLVKWLGYSSQENTWQPISHLKNVPEKIRKWKNQKKRRQINIRKKLQQKNKNSCSQITNMQSSPQSNNSKNREKVTSVKNKSIKKTIKRNKDPQSLMKQQRKEQDIKRKKIQKQKNSKPRNEQLQAKKSKQIMVIKIQDSSDEQMINQSEQEIVEEDSVSYTSQEHSNSQQIQQPQAFLNINTSQQNNQKQQPQVGPVQIINKSGDNPINMNQNQNIYLQFIENDEGLMPQIGLMEKILSQEGNFNIGESKRQNEGMHYEKFSKLKVIWEEEDKLWCNVITNKGITFSKIPYQSIQNLRPDLISNFYRFEK